MTRINIYAAADESDWMDDGAPQLLGHFDISKAEQWSDADYDGNGSGGVGRGQAVLRTAGGKWVLAHWTRWQDERDRYEYIEEGTAKDWLLRNHEDEAVAKYFGEIPDEEDRRPGRPTIGDPVNVRLGDLLGRVDAFAAAAGRTRAEAIRELVTAGLTKLEER